MSHGVQSFELALDLGIGPPFNISFSHHFPTLLDHRLCEYPVDQITPFLMLQFPKQTATHELSHHDEPHNSTSIFNGTSGHDAGGEANQTSTTEVATSSYAEQTSTVSLSPSPLLSSSSTEKTEKMGDTNTVSNTSSTSVTSATPATSVTSVMEPTENTTDVAIPESDSPFSYCRMIYPEAEGIFVISLTLLGLLGLLFGVLVCFPLRRYFKFNSARKRQNNEPRPTTVVMYSRVGEKEDDSTL